MTRKGLIHMEGKGLSYFYITLAAVLWGITGLFTKTLTELGFTPAEMNFARNLVAVAIIGIWFFITDKNVFKIEKAKDFAGFAIIAIFGYCAYGISYVIAINETSVGVAGALFYAYPTFVLIFSRFIFGEKITPKKVVVILLATVGCLFVSGAMEAGSGDFSLKGIFYGILSAVTFAIYNILSKKYLGNYSSKTVTFYIFLVAVVTYGCMINPIATVEKVTQKNAWFEILKFGVAISVIPYLAHLKGLENVEASKAAIISTTEPISAMLLGVLLYHESPTTLKIAGIVLIIASVCFMSAKIGENWEYRWKKRKGGRPIV